MTLASLLLISGIISTPSSSSPQSACRLEWAYCAQPDWRISLPSRRESSELSRPDQTRPGHTKPNQRPAPSAAGYSATKLGLQGGLVGRTATVATCCSRARSKKATDELCTQTADSAHTRGASSTAATIEFSPSYLSNLRVQRARRREESAKRESPQRAAAAAATPANRPHLIRTFSRFFKTIGPFLFFQRFYSNHNRWFVG